LDFSSILDFEYIAEIFKNRAQKVILSGATYQVILRAFDICKCSFDDWRIIFSPGIDIIGGSLNSHDRYWMFSAAADGISLVFPQYQSWKVARLIMDTIDDFEVTEYLKNHYFEFETQAESFQGCSDSNFHVLISSFVNNIKVKFLSKSDTGEASYFLKSFQHDFYGNFNQGVTDIILQLQQYIDFVRNSFYNQSSKYYSPYFTICQSSGVGKSMSIAQLAKRVLLIPICLRPADDYNTQPPRTPALATYILTEAPGKEESWWQLLIVAIASTVAIHCKNFHSFESWYNVMIDATGEVVNIWDQAIQSHKDLVKHHLEASISILPETIDSILRGNDDIDYSCLQTAVLVIDEANPLLQTRNKIPVEESPYVKLCRALSHLSGFIPLVTIFIDTNSSVTNFAPESRFHISGRVNTGKCKLYPVYCSYPVRLLPLILTGTNENAIPDVVYKFRYEHSISVLDRALVVRTNPLVLALFSRALFCTWLINKARTFSIPFEVNKLACDIYDLAKCKLIPETHDIDLLNFSLASCRFSLSTTCVASLKLLVKQHLAVLLAIDTDDQANMLVEYPLEPLLSCVAADHMISDYENWLQVVRALCKEKRRGQLECNGIKGVFGELVATIILSKAFDSTCVNFLQYADKKMSKCLILSEKMSSTGLVKRQKISSSSIGDEIRNVSSEDQGSCSPDTFRLNWMLGARYISSMLVPAIEFLQQLFRPDGADGINIAGTFAYDDARYGLVNFTRFLQVEDDMSVPFLRELLMKGAAAVAQTGEKGNDLYIPMAIPIIQDNGLPCVVDLADDTTYDVSAIIIQVKNTKMKENSMVLWKRMQETPIANDLSASNTPHIYGIMHMGLQSGDLAEKVLSDPPVGSQAGSKQDASLESLTTHCFVLSYDGDIPCLNSPEGLKAELTSLLRERVFRQMIVTGLTKRSQASGDKYELSDKDEHLFRPDLIYVKEYCTRL
jgi:hypothetical protein